MKIQQVSVSMPIVEMLNELENYFSDFKGNTMYFLKKASSDEIFIVM